MRNFQVLTFLLFILVNPSLGNSANFDPKISWRVASEHFKCVLDHLNSYKASPDKFVVIYLADCPNNDAMAALQKTTKNIGTNLRGKAVVKTQNIIVYDKKSLGCLSQLELDFSNNNITIPQQPCEK